MPYILWRFSQRSKIGGRETIVVGKIKQAARDLECDPDEAKWEDKLRKVVKQKPVPEKPE